MGRRAGIKQDLKSIAHTHSPTFRIGADSAHSFLDGLEDAFRSKRRDQPGMAGLVLGPRIRQPGDGNHHGTRSELGKVCCRICEPV